MRRAAVLAFLCALTGAAPAQAARSLELGVQDDPVLLHRSYGDTAVALDRAADLGADRIRVNLVWGRSMPDAQSQASQPPAVIEWDFSKLEALHAAAAARAIKLQVTLAGPAPAWSSPADAAGFAEFAAAAVRAFAGRIDRWSVWNEPNWHRSLSPAAKAPSRYRALYRAAYTAIKREDPRAKVLIGELMPGANSERSTPALKFLRAVACARRDYRRSRKCSPLYADGFALHPYNFSRRPRDAKSSNRDVVEMGSLARLTGALDKLRRARLLRTRSGAAMPVYLTEFGYFTQGSVARTPTQHAAWMAEAWRIAERNSRVKQLLQYQLVDPWPEHVTWRTAILDRDGAPRPVYDRLRALAR